MCGIFLLKSNENSNSYLSEFKKSLNELKSRGPDEITFIKKKNYLIGFTRLSINDLHKQCQPLESKNKRYTLLFNGEILNYKSLISHIVEKNITLKDNTEAEVILTLYIIYNKKFLNYIRGFFSIVIIDHYKDEVFACVDQFSIKPLYYYNNNKFTVFTSNLSPLINNKLVNKNINHDEIINFVTLGRELNNKTIYKNIYKLMASTYLTLNKHKIEIKKYWSPFKDKTKFPFSKNSYFGLSNNLDRVCNLWKTSDVKLSHTLSTGIDSRLLNLFFKKNNIRTTNFLLRERFNQKISKNDHEINYLDFNFNKILSNYLKTNLDPTPLANSSSMVLFPLYKEISEKKFKVSFSGEGADELFGGYTRYLKHQQLIKKRKGNLYKSFLDLYKKEIEYSNYAVNKKNFNVQNHLYNQIKKIKLKSKSDLNKILEFDQITWIPSVTKRHDSIGMFYSLEIRPPFLDIDLVNYVNNLSENLKIFNHDQKIISKQLLFSKKIYKKFNKISTPNPSDHFFLNMTKSKKKKFKERIFYGNLSKYYNPKRTWEICTQQFGQTNHIFLWRIFILTKILK